MTTPTPKYANPLGVELPDRQWPGRRLTQSPQWCSVDLRDGNQSLPNPLTPERKLTYFDMLCNIGFKHIEVAFPSASQDDFDFTRKLIEENLIPPDVFIMGLSQCREHLIARTFESFRDLARGVVHLYCATSDLHMQQVFGLSRKQTLDMVVKAIAQTRDLAATMPGSDLRLEFSPEEFTDSDPQFALEICQAVVETWGAATPEKPVILNLPATVERRPPNQYADQIEWFCRYFGDLSKVVISVHSHNDQGMAVAGTELALLAGAQRVEGTLFGHGERTGNVDIVTMANNFLSRGIETGLDFSNLPKIVEIVEKLTDMPIYYRQPYSGEYVFTAFSGSHQDAIRKGLNQRDESAKKFGTGWKIPYLHIDPTDLGRTYEELIRINAQSGKGGVAWVLEQNYGLKTPKAMHPEIGQAVQRFSDRVRRELTSEEVHQVFGEEFVSPGGRYELLGYWPRPDDQDPTRIHGQVKVRVDGVEKTVTAAGNGPVSAFVACMRALGAEEFAVEDYDSQALGKGAEAVAVAYVPLRFDGAATSIGNVTIGGRIVHVPLRFESMVLYGVGIDTNIDQAAVRAIIAALNRRAATR